MKNPGRPEFLIEKSRLRSLRDTAKLTQEALGAAVFGGKASKPITMTRSYQRIERAGRTSEKTAWRLAEELAKALRRNTEGVMSELRGGEPEPPPDRVTEIEQQLRAQLASGGNASLEQALKRHSEDDDPVKELARHVSQRLEVAQLEQRSGELSRLAELTGWAEKELQRPISLQGYWLLRTNSNGYRETQILLGLSDVLEHVKTEGTEWLHLEQQSDARAELIEDAPWFRVLLHRLRGRLYKEFSFVRCAPSAAGLRWVKPTEWDRWLVDGLLGGGLRGWAFENSNFVKDFGAAEESPRDLRKLRFVVDRRVRPVNLEKAKDSDFWKREAVHKGDLDELPEKALSDLQKEGTAHALVTNWLASGLWEEVLMPRLAPLPLDWWQIAVWGSSIRVGTKSGISLRLTTQYELEPEGRAFFISLAQEGSSGELTDAPWRPRSIATLVKDLQDKLDACKTQVDTDPNMPAYPAST
jgi:hypothetical protein